MKLTQHELQIVLVALKYLILKVDVTTYPNYPMKRERLDDIESVANKIRKEKE